MEARRQRWFNMPDHKRREREPKMRKCISLKLTCRGAPTCHVLSEGIGEVMRKGGPGNSNYFEIGVWFDEAEDSIQIASNDVASLHTTVRANAKLRRGHPNLFKKLTKILRENDAPAPQNLPDA